MLWLPETAKELICIDSEDLDSDDIELQAFINQATVDWLNGKLDTGTLTDIYLQYGIDPSRIDDAERLVNK